MSTDIAIMADRSSSGLSFKIRLNPKSKAVEDGRKDEDQEEFLSHTCKICGKKFRSGKALGGHRRMHFEARKKKPGPKHSFNQLNAGSIDRRLLPTGSSNNSVVSGSASASAGTNNTGSQSASCYACSKVFPSMKSLFGHMRSHPERSWRGIHPPASLTNSKLCVSSTSSSTSNGHVPPGFPLLNKAIDLNHQVESSFVASKMLGTWPGKTQALDLSRFLPSWPVTAKRGRKSNTIGSSTSVTSSEEEEEEDVVDDIDACHLILQLAHGMTPNSRTPQSSNKTRKIDHVLDEAAGYKYNICNKTFPTHQALGRHMSCHSKARSCKNVRAIISAVPDPNPDINGGPYTSTNTRKLNTTEEVSQAGARKMILDIDLNEPPPVTED